MGDKAKRDVERTTLPALRGGDSRFGALPPPFGRGASRFGARLSRTALGLLCAAGLAACAGEGPAAPSAANQLLSSIAVRPGGPVLRAIEATHQLTATAFDSQGQPIEGVEFSWSSSDEEVATVSAEGLVTARGNGEATIEAAAEDQVGRTRLAVAQAAQSVSLRPTEATLGGPGAEIRFEASGQDPNGHPVAPDRFVWTSSSPSVVAVDDSGRASARATGEAKIRAAVGTVRADAVVNVGDAEPPTVLAVSPAPLVEGGEATLTGEHFGSTSSAVRVTVDGVEAAARSISESELVIDVPTFDCRPPRTAEIVVSVDGFTAPTHLTRLEPTAGPLQLEAGQQLLLASPDDFCFRLEETTGEEEYLIGVQSTASVVSGLTGVTITSVVAGGDGQTTKIALNREPPSTKAPVSRPRPPDVRSPFVRGRGAPRLIGGEETERRELEALWRSHRATEAALRAWERGRLFPSRSDVVVREEDRGAAMPRSEAELPAVGESLSLRIPDISSGGSCGAFTEVDAVVRAVGRRGIWLEDPENPSSGFGEADFQAMSDQLDDAIYDTNVAYFGVPSDLDGNGRILVVVSKELNRTAPTTMGFVFGGDLFSRSSCRASDQAEIFYGRAPDPSGRYGSVFSTEDALRAYPRLIAHELSHIIQLGRRLAAGRPYMTSWMMEGQALIAEEVVGHALTGRAPGADYEFDVAFNWSDTDPVDWYKNGFTDMAFYFGYETGSSKVSGAPQECGWLRQDPSPCIGRPLWYGVAWSFLRWVSDHFGPDHAGGEAALHRALVDSGQNGFDNVSARTAEPADQMLAQWAASLYLDGQVDGVAARLTLPSWNLNAIFGRLVPAARLQPLVRSFSDFEAVGAVRAGSTGYLRLEGEGRPATAVRIRDADDAPLLGAMQVWLVRIR